MTDAPPSPRPLVAALGRYTPGRATEGMVKLSSNESPFPPSRRVRDRVTQAIEHCHRYPPHRSADLVDLICRHVSTTETIFGPDQVAISNGSVALLRHLFEAFVEPGGEVVVGWRSFEVYAVFAGLCAAQLVKVPLDHDMFDVEAIIAAVGPTTSLVLLTSPNNPTGSVIGHDALVALLEAVPPTCLVVIDNAYAEFDCNVDTCRPLELVASHPNLFVVRTLSKAYALAGLRLGYGVGHPEVVTAIEACRTPFEVSGVALAAGVAALEAPTEALPQINRTILERHRCLRALWQEGIGVGASQGNFLWLSAGRLTARFQERLFADGYLVREFAGEGLRVSLGTPDENDGWLRSIKAVWSDARLPRHDPALLANAGALEQPTLQTQRASYSLSLWDEHPGALD
jgi:histidinol-phosphate aminotransferase